MSLINSPRLPSGAAGRGGQGGLDGAAPLVAEDDDRAAAEVFDGVLDAADDLAGATSPATRMTKRSPRPWSKMTSGDAPVAQRGRGERVLASATSVRRDASGGRDAIF